MYAFCLEEQKGLAYHLEGLRVPLVVRVPQFGNHWFRWCPGQEISLVPPCSNLSYFGSKCTVVKKVLMILLGSFGTPCDLAAGELCLFYPPRYVPDYMHYFWGSASGDSLSTHILYI